MHNRFARAFTATGLVFTLWAVSLAAAPLPRRQQQQDAQKQQSQQKDVAAKKTADDKTAQPAATPSNPGKPLS
jgi:Ni/Co efflux regulator RcnB